jgi:nucleoside-diphosphate-sugar epimerase
MVLSKGLVAVTGAGGYIGSWCVKDLVDNGYQARGTVRSLNKPEKVKHLKEMNAPVELFEADLLVEGSFDACFAGCSAVFHVASPFMFTSDDPQKNLIDPAVKGTLNVLESCKRAGVKRVVLTSSCAAVVEQDSATNPEKYKGKVWTEKDWNTTCTIENAPYFLSKVLAERAAWEFCEKNDIVLTTICPNFVMGPPLSTRGDSTSVNMVQQLLNGAFIEEGLPNWAYGLVHVRTVAESHTLALENKGAENERILVAGRISRTCLDMINWLRLDQQFADRKMASRFAEPVISNPIYDNSKAIKILSLRFRPAAIGVMKTGMFLYKNGMIDLHAKDEDDAKLSIE